MCVCVNTHTHTHMTTLGKCLKMSFGSYVWAVKMAQQEKKPAVQAW